MRLLRTCPIWKQKKEDFDKLTDYLQYELKALEISGAVAFGGALRAECTDSTHSDIDIVAYSQIFNRETAEKCLNIISNADRNFFDKPPLFLEDFISKRIEFYIELGNTKFDINIFPVELGGYEKRYVNATHDSLDVVIGAMYIEGGLLFGKIPFEEIIENEFLPFYNDRLRETRMSQLEDRIRSELLKMQTPILFDKSNVLYQTYKIRKYLIKWMFINARKYPVDLERYLKRQLTQVLNLSEHVVSVLLLDSNSLVDAYQDFIQLTLDIISHKNK